MCACFAPESFGAAMQYFTGSKAHNVALRQRALKMGFTLNEYSLATLEDEKPVARKTEEEIYAKLKLDFIPPELRENLGEIEAAANHKLPKLIERVRHPRRRAHAHHRDRWPQHDRRNGRSRARPRLSIHRHHRPLEESGLRQRPHRRTRAGRTSNESVRPTKQIKGIRIFAGIEVDILADGPLDLSDAVLEQMDIVIASVHSHFNQDRATMTDRLLKAIANPNTSLIGHPTGRQLLRRDAYQFDLDAVLKAAAKHKVAMELNSYPDRLDLCDVHLRLAKQHGVKIVINTDSHHTSHMEKIRYGITQARRAWLTKDDVLNTLPVTSSPGP